MNRETMSRFAKKHFTPSEPIIVLLVCCIIIFLITSIGLLYYISTRTSYYDYSSDIQAIVIVVVLILFSLGASLFFARYLSKVSRDNKLINFFNSGDFKVSEFISFNIQANLRNIHSANIMSASEVIRISGMRIGEVGRHFDQQTNALYASWLERRLGIQSLKFGLQNSNANLGFSSVNLVEQAEQKQYMHSTTRDNLLGDGFVAVFEYITPNGFTDIVRVVVPSEPASRDFLQIYMADLGRTFGVGSHCEEAILSSLSVLQKSFTTDISYVSDRLNAILRMPPLSRPSIDIIGAKITDHAILGSVIYFSDTRQWHYLFPVNIVLKINEIARQAESMRGPLPSLNP